MVEPLDSEAADSGARSVPVALQIDRVNDIAVHRELNLRLHERIRALSKAMHDADDTKLLLDGGVLDQSVVIIRRRIVCLSADILAVDLDAPVELNLALVKQFKRIQSVLIPFQVVDSTLLVDLLGHAEFVLLKLLEASHNFAIVLGVSSELLL